MKFSKKGLALILAVLLLATLAVVLTACGGKEEHSCTFKEVADPAYLKTAATCTASAEYYKSCTCGKKSDETFTSGSPAAHTARELADPAYLKTAATCEAGALYYKSCSVCEASLSDTFTAGSPAPHTPRSLAEERYLKTAATCEAGALYHKSCSVCEAPLSDTFVSGTPTAHSYLETVDPACLKTAATCTASAVYYKSCACGEKSGDTFVSGTPAAHTPRSLAEDRYLETAASCSAAALYHKSCSVCEGELEETFTSGDPLAHTPQSLTDTRYLKTAATCTTPGVYYKSCSVCEAKLEETFNGALAPHGDVHFVAEEAAGCTESGVMAHYTCHDCGKYFSDEAATAEVPYQSLVITGSHSYEERVTEDPAGLKSAATCLAPATYFKWCPTCGDFSADVFTSGEPIEHRYEVHEVVEPACYEGGYTIEMCVSGCGNTRTVDPTAALEHDFDTVTVEATHNAPGSVTKTCKNGCGYTEEEFIPPIAHSHTPSVTAPTCTAVGFTTYTCSCGDSYVSDEVAALDHEFDTVTVEATCIAEGSVTRTCSRIGCGKVVVEVLPISDTHAEVAATCDADGYCSVCQKKLSPATGHAWELFADVAPTCLGNGYLTYICTRDADHIKQEYPETHKQLSHFVESWTKETVEVEGKTCTFRVKESGYCVNGCREFLERYGEETVTHTYVAAIHEEADCQHAGTKVYTCACGDVKKDAETGEAYYESYTASEAHRYDADGNCTVEGCSKAKVTVADDQVTADIQNSDLEKEIAFKDAALSLDESTREQLGDADVTMRAETLTDADAIADMKNDLSEEHKALLEGKNIYNFEMTVGDEPITEFDGFITIKIPYELNGEDPDDIVVWYLAVVRDEEGNPIPDGNGGYLHELEPVEADYIVIEGKGYAVFETEHFSYYTVTRMTPAERCAKFDSHATGELVVVLTYPATCEADGYTLHSCLRCGEKWTTDVVSALGHSFSCTDEVAGDCTTDHTRTFTCGNCHISYIEREEAPGHEWEKTAQTAASCTVAGSEHYECTRCEDFYDVVLPILPHDYEDRVTEATCTEAGFTERTCLACGHSITAAYHAPLGHLDEVRVTEPTCFSGGYTEHYCERCMSVYKVDGRTDPVGHEWDREEPDCENDKLCRHCHKRDENAAGGGKAHGHDFEGSTCKKCQNECEHENLKSLPDQNPTCSEVGYKRYLCRDCKNQLLGEVIPTTEHRNETVGERAATCTTPACVIEKCKVCKTETVTTVGKPIDHSFVAGICRYCGKSDTLFYNNLVHSLFTGKGGAFYIKDLTVIAEETDLNGIFKEVGGLTTVNLNELFLCLDENGNIDGAAIASIVIENGPRTGIVHLDFKALIEDGSVYLEATSDFLDMNLSGRYTLEVFFEMLFGEIGITEEALREIFSILDEEVLPLVDLLVSANDEEINVTIESLLDMLFTRTAKESGECVFVLDFDKLCALNENLATLPLAEVIDLYFGEGSYRNLSDFILELLSMKLSELPGYIAELGIDNETLYTAIDNILLRLMGQEGDIESFFASADADIEIGLLIFGEEGYLDMVMDALALLEETSLYELIASEAAESLEGEFKSILDTFADKLTFSFTTAENGKYLGFDVSLLPIVVSERSWGRESFGGSISFVADGVIDVTWADVVDRILAIENEIPESERSEDEERAYTEMEEGYMEYGGRVYSYTGFRTYVEKRVYDDELLGFLAYKNCGDWVQIDLNETYTYTEFTYSLRALTDESGNPVIFLLCNSDASVVIELMMDGETSELYFINEDGERVVIDLSFMNGSGEENEKPPMGGDEEMPPVTTTVPPMTTAPTAPMLPPTQNGVQGEKILVSATGSYYPAYSAFFYGAPISNELATHLFGESTSKYSYRSVDANTFYLNLLTGELSHRSMHKYELVEERIPTSCAELYYARYKCVHCGDTYEQEYSRISHRYEVDYAQSEPPVCGEWCTVVKVCTECGALSRTESHFSHDYESTHRLHEGASSCYEGVDEIWRCIWCGDSYIGTENYAFGHVYEYCYTLEGDTLYRRYACAVCGEADEEKSEYCSVLATDTAVRLENNGGMLAVTPTKDGVYELYSLSSGYSEARFADVYDYRNHIIYIDGNIGIGFYTKGNIGIGSNFGYLVNLKAGVTYYLTLSVGQDAEVVIKPHDASKDKKIALSEYGCTCGGMLEELYAFGGIAFRADSHSYECGLTVYYGESTISSCKGTYTSYANFYLGDQAVGEYRTEPYTIYDEPRHSAVWEDYDGNTRSTVTLEDGREIIARTEAYTLYCRGCGDTVGRREHSEYFEDETLASYLGDRTLTYKMTADGEAYLAKETRREYRGYEAYNWVYTAEYAEDGVTVLFWERYDYTYSGCSVTETYTNSRGEERVSTEYRHTTGTKEVVEEGSTVTATDAAGNPITVVTEVYEEYCTSCLSVFKREKRVTTYNEKGETVRTVQTTLLPYAESATVTGFRPVYERVEEYRIFYRPNGEQLSCKTLQRETYYAEDGSVKSFTQHEYRYEDGSPCSWLEVYTDSTGGEWSEPRTSHNTVSTFRLAEGAHSCYDGLEFGSYCMDCGRLEWDGKDGDIYRPGYHPEAYHLTVCYDASSIGSACGGRLVLTSCACGQQRQLRDELGCDLDYHYDYTWDDGNGKYEYYSYTYGCAVTDTAEGRNPCGFAYSYETWYEIDAECRKTYHRRYVLNLSSESPIVIEWSYSNGEYAHSENEERNRVNTMATEDGLEIYTEEYDLVCTHCGFVTEHRKHVYRVDPTLGAAVKETSVTTYYEKGYEGARQVHTREYTSYLTQNGWMGQMTLDEYVYFDRSGAFSSADRWVYDYARITSHDGLDSRVVKTLEKNCRFDSLESYNAEAPSHWFMTEWDYTCACRARITETDSDGYRNVYDGSENHWSFTPEYWQTEPTCTQPGVAARDCRWCDEVSTWDYSAYGHSYHYDGEECIYRCSRCALENFVGQDGDIVLEDLTWKLGAGEYYVLGYYDKGYDRFDVKVSLILNPKTEQEEALLLNDFIHIDRRTSLLYVSIADVKAAIATLSAMFGEEFSICRNMVRIEFVSLSTGTSNDYGITLDPHILSYTADAAEEGAGAAFHSATCTECGERVKSGETCDFVLSGRDSYVEDGTVYEVETYACRHCENGKTVTTWRELSDADSCLYAYRMRTEWTNGVVTTETLYTATEHTYAYSSNGFAEGDEVPTHAWRCTACGATESLDNCYNQNYWTEYRYTEGGVEKAARYQYCACGFTFKTITYKTATENGCEHAYHTEYYWGFDKASGSYGSSLALTPYTELDHEYGEYVHIDGDGTALPLTHMRTCTACGGVEITDCSMYWDWDRDLYFKDGIAYTVEVATCSYCEFSYSSFSGADVPLGDSCMDGYKFTHYQMYKNASGEEVLLVEEIVGEYGYHVPLYSYAAGENGTVVRTGICACEAHGPYETGLTVNSPYTLVPVTVGTTQYFVFSFTPTASGAYEFYSNDYGIYGAVLDADGNILAKNNNLSEYEHDGYGDSHGIVVSLEAGQTYYLVAAYDGERPFVPWYYDGGGYTVYCGGFSLYFDHQ